MDKILAANAENNHLSALSLIDLDDFKCGNDTLVHDFGDLLLCEVAGRLKNCVRTVAMDKEFSVTDFRMFEATTQDSVFRLHIAGYQAI